MLAVSLVAFSYTWLRGTGETSKEQTELMAGQIEKGVGSSFKVEAASENKIYIRNTGKGVIAEESLSVYVDEKLVKFSLKDPDNPANNYVGEGRRGVIEISGVSGEHNVKIKTGLATEIIGGMDLGFGILSNGGLNISFVPPTEPNNSYISRNWTEINITIDEQNRDTFKFNWNQTNYTFYDDSLVLALNFNNNSAIGENSTYAVDVSKYGNDGTIHGATWTDGKFGKALSFDGVDDYVEVPDSDSLNITDAITIELG